MVRTRWRGGRELNRTCGIDERGGKKESRWTSRRGGMRGMLSRRKRLSDGGANEAGGEKCRGRKERKDPMKGNREKRSLCGEPFVARLGLRSDYGSSPRCQCTRDCSRRRGARSLQVAILSDEGFNLLIQVAVKLGRCTSTVLQLFYVDEVQPRAVRGRKRSGRRQVES